LDNISDPEQPAGSEEPAKPTPIEPTPDAEPVESGATNGHTTLGGIDAARACLAIYRGAAQTAQAAGHDGIFVLTPIDAKTEKAKPQRFATKNTDGMAAEGVACAATANIYFSTALLKKSLGVGARGTKEDIVVVLALPIDDDPDDGKPAVLPPGITPTLEVTTSRVPRLNRHHHFVFDRPLGLAEAEDLAELLHRKCGGDHGTGDVDHVWRLPGTLNYPNKVKLKRGRPKEPQAVTLTGGSRKLIDPAELRRALESMPDRRPPRAARGNGDGQYRGGSTDAAEIIARLPGWLIDHVETEVAKEEGDRSAHSFKTMSALMEHGCSDDEIELLAADQPFASKFTERGDLSEEINRVRERWEADGKKLVPPPQGKAQVAASTSDAPDAGIKVWPVLVKKARIGIVADIATVATRKSEADPIAVKASMLVAGGALFGRSRFMRVGDSVHHARVFGALVGASSRARKGTSYDPIRRIIRATETVLQSESTLPFPCGRSLQISPGPLSSAEGLIDAIRDKRGPEDDGGVDDKRLLCIEGEFGSVLRACQRQGNTLSTVVRVAWDGWTLAPLTKKDKIRATDPHICIIAHITRNELAELLTASDVWNGFANRFLWNMVRRGSQHAFPQPMPDDDVDRIAKNLAGVVEYAHQCAAEKRKPEVRFSNKAADLWANVYSEISRDYPGILGAVTSRAEAQTLRLALTFALFDGADFISEKHLEAAIAFWRYCFDSAKYLFGGVELDPVAQTILQALGSGPKSQSEIRDLFARHITAERLTQVLMDLQEKGRITYVEIGGTGGRPRRVWSLAR
jgi:hypothetical protein